MKQVTQIAALLPLCILLLSAPVLAANTDAPDVSLTEPLLSPAIRILADRNRMKKNNVEDTGAVGDAYVPSGILFSASDFSDVLGYTPSEIVITSLPERSVGALKLGTLDVMEGSVLSASAMEHLTFLPVGNTETDLGETAAIAAAADTAEGVRSTSFTFTARGRVYKTDTPLTCELYLLPRDNDAPQPVSLEIGVTTYTETALHGRVTASDPEADALTYEIVRMPKKGTVTLDSATGAYVYTPNAGKRGGDVFTCRVSDEWGNKSELFRVEVEIRRAGESLCYADLDGSPYAAAAMYVTDEGVMSGTDTDGIRLFSPDTPMTRGEFLVSAMKAADIDVADTDLNLATVFADGDTVPVYMKPYLAAAYTNGIVSGMQNEAGETVFAPECTITYAEAAVTLARLFDLQSSDTAAVFASGDTFSEDAVPAWSVSAVSALGEMGMVVPAENVTSPVTRITAAQLLATVMQ